MLRESAEDVVGAALEVSAKMERMAVTLEASIFVAICLKIVVCLGQVIVEVQFVCLVLERIFLKIVGGSANVGGRKRAARNDFNIPLGIRPIAQLCAPRAMRAEPKLNCCGTWTFPGPSRLLSVHLYQSLLLIDTLPSW